MSRVGRWSRWGVTHLSPWVLGLALFTFLLPFSSVSCAAPQGYGSVGGGVTATYRGVTLALGGQPDLDPADRGLPPGATAAEDHVSPQPAAAGALALTVAALVASLVVAHRRQVWVASLAAGALALAVLAQVVFDQQWTERMMTKLQSVNPRALASADTIAFVRPAAGFWLLLVLLATTTLTNAALAVWLARKSATSRPSRNVSPEGATSTPGPPSPAPPAETSPTYNPRAA